MKMQPPVYLQPATLRFYSAPWKYDEYPPLFLLRPMLYYSRRNEILHENNVSNFFSCVLRTFIPKYGKIGVANFYCCNSHLISIF